MGQEAGVPLHLPPLWAAVDQPVHCRLWVRLKTASHNNHNNIINNNNIVKIYYHFYSYYDCHHL